MARQDTDGYFHGVLELNHRSKDHDPCFIGSLTSAGHSVFWMTVENDTGRTIKSRKYDYQGQVLEESSLPIFTGHHIITSQGSVYFYKESTETIELVQGDKTFTIVSLRDLQLYTHIMVCGMYCNASRVIFLTMSSELMEYGVILRCDIACGHVSTIQYDSSGHMLYKSPRCTVENQNKIMCTVDANGIILFDLCTSQTIQCPKLPSSQYVATFKNQFVIQYETYHQHKIGLLSETGDLLSYFQIPLCGIRAMYSDDEEDLLFVIKDGSVIKGMYFPL